MKRELDGNKDCTCVKWRRQIITLRRAIKLKKIQYKQAWRKPLGNKWIAFDYCPWCGRKLNDREIT